MKRHLSYIIWFIIDSTFSITVWFINEIKQLFYYYGLHSKVLTVSYNKYGNLWFRYSARSFLSEAILNNVVSVGEELMFTIITIEKWKTNKTELVYGTRVTARLTLILFL